MKGEDVNNFTELVLYNAYLLESAGSDLDEIPIQLAKRLSKRSINSYFRLFHVLATTQADLHDFG